MALRKPLEAHFEHFWALLPKWLSRSLWRLILNISGPKGTRETAWWRTGYERNSGMGPRKTKNTVNYTTNSGMDKKNAVNYEINSLRPKGTQEMLANLTKVMIYKGKLHTAPHLSREIRKSQTRKIPA